MYYITYLVPMYKLLLPRITPTWGNCVHSLTLFHSLVVRYLFVVSLSVCIGTPALSTIGGHTKQGARLK